MTQKDINILFKESAERNLATARSLIKIKHYDWALYLGHLALEKMLKGLVAKKTKKSPPYIHDLAKLAILADLQLTRTQLEDLEEITTYNIKARYDNIKQQFYKKATPAYTDKYFRKIEEFILWIKKLY